MERTTRSIIDALRIASKDMQFAQDLIANPEEYRAQYNLTDAHIAAIRNTRVSEVLDRLRPGGGGVGPRADYY